MSDMQENNNINIKSYDKKKIIIIILLVILLVVGVTLALVSGVSVVNGRYSFQTACFDVDYNINDDDGSNTIEGDLMASSTYEGGLFGQVSLSFKPSCNTKGLADLFININEKKNNSVILNAVEPHCEDKVTLETLDFYSDESSCVASEGVWVENGGALKYAVFEEGIDLPVSVGYINKLNSNIGIYEQFIISNDYQRKFSIYIWLDGNLADNNYLNLSFFGQISAQVSQIKDTEEVEEDNLPKLNNNMIPVKISNNGSVHTVDKNSEDWYNYENKEWANSVITVNENSSTSAYDLSGNSTSNTISGAVYGSNGLVLDGTNDYVKLPYIDVASKSVFTMEAEFTPDSYASGSEVDLLSNWQGGGVGLTLDDGYVTFNVYDNGATAYVGVNNSSRITVGDRYLITGVYDGSVISLYINGSFVGSKELSGSIKNTTSSTIFAVGCNPEGTSCPSSSKYFDGIVHSVRFYDKVLSSDEIISNYNKSIVTDGLLFGFDYEIGKSALYKNTTDVVIPESEILAYYVWIPRYKYKIWTLGSDSSLQTIELEFESASEAPSYGTFIGSWRTHPAFIWDGNTISGFWVGKFETGHSTLTEIWSDNTLGCTDSNCTNADGIIIKPNVKSLRYNSVSNMFFASKSMARSGNPFGFDSTLVDIHMSKNSEWGAVAYLSNSNYGTNSKVVLNNFYDNSYGYKTGCGASSSSGAQSNTCSVLYGSATSYSQSTTGNISGVFDMSGGAWDVVMGVYNGTIGSSGFTTLPEAKYYDNYTSLDIINACGGTICFGHALSETTGWHSEYNKMLLANEPWFYRGGPSSYTTESGIFAYGKSAGQSSASYSFRLSLILN